MISHLFQRSLNASSAPFYRVSFSNTKIQRRSTDFVSAERDGFALRAVLALKATHWSRPGSALRSSVLPHALRSRHARAPHHSSSTSPLQELRTWQGTWPGQVPGPLLCQLRSLQRALSRTFLRLLVCINSEFASKFAHFCFSFEIYKLSSSRCSLWSALLSHVAHRGKARGQGRRFASQAQRVSYITATRHFNGDPGVCFIGTAPGSSLTLPFGSPNRAVQLAPFVQLAPKVECQNQHHSSKCDETKRSLDCVWQALGVEHVSLHSSLASHLQVLYFIIFLIQRSLNVLQSANLNCASISTKIQFRSTDSIRLKGTDLLREQNFMDADLQSGLETLRGLFS